MKRRNPRFQRSDIPYADRLLMDRYRDVGFHRDEAARTVLHLACVALNDTEGLGRKRLVRFAARLREQIQEYYSDTEVGAVHLKTRLEQLGFKVVNGHLIVVEDECGNIVEAKRMFPDNVANPEVSGDA